MNRDRDDDARDLTTENPPRKPVGSSSVRRPFEEKHYTVSELAEMWNMSRETVRRLVMFEPDVIKLRMGKKKAHIHYLIPESVAQRIHTRLKNAS